MRQNRTVNSEVGKETNTMRPTIAPAYCLGAGSRHCAEKGNQDRAQPSPRIEKLELRNQAAKIARILRQTTKQEGAALRALEFCREFPNL